MGPSEGACQVKILIKSVCVANLFLTWLALRSLGGRGRGGGGGGRTLIFCDKMAVGISCCIYD